ncbi:MAG TPA: hypothetical protein DCM87_11710 [Planctomycetes bacterium]|nr:hypothetical protein [Planctomycetota bacterium]
MAAQQLFIGIDAGGTKTACMAVAGRSKAMVAGGPGNLFGVGRTGFAVLLRGLVKALRARGRIDARQAASVCVGGAGLGRRRERAAARTIVAKLFPRAHVAVVDDATLFLWAAFGPDEPGIALIAGTGSMCIGRDGAGRTARAGGWGPLLGDPGSAFALGRRAIAHALAVRDGIEKPSPLARAVTRHFGVAGALDVLSRIGVGGPAAVASFAPRVLRAASRGERTAARIVAEEAAALGSFVKGVAVQLGARPRAVACGGGLFANSYYAGAAARAIRATAGAGRVFVPRVRPVQGAIAIARAQVTHAAH